VTGADAGGGEKRRRRSCHKFTPNNNIRTLSLKLMMDSGRMLMCDIVAWEGVRRTRGGHVAVRRHVTILGSKMIDGERHARLKD